MLGLAFLVLVAVPIVELIVILRVADWIGFAETFVALILISAAGAWLLRQQGTATWRRFNETMARGEMPTREATDGVLIIVGGALLLTPGFVTDVVGLLLLFPVTRALLKGTARSLFSGWARRKMRIAGIYPTTATRRDPRVRPEGGREGLPPEPDEGGSRDRE